MLSLPTIFQFLMQACIGTGQFLRREAEGSLGPQFLGTTTMRHLSGRLTGFLPAESQKFAVRRQTSQLQIYRVSYGSITMLVAGAEQCSFRGTPRIDLTNTEINNNRLSYSASGPKELWPSVSNYVLQILSSKGADPVAFLYFLDSGGGSYPEVISSAQAKWFQARSQVINPNGKVPEIIFWHIPSVAFSKVAPKPNSGIDKPCVGSINFESVAPQEAEWGIMDVLAKRPSVKAIFSGHNHGLDWCCPYQKLWLCFARHTGYGGYGDWPRGARIIEITEQPFSLKSWIRMENGTEHSDLILSS